MKKLCALLSLVVMLGCQKTVTVHPGAISNFDSYSYDILLVEQDAINTARAQFVSGQLPAAARESLNVAIDQYNAAENVWQTYHSTGQGQSALQQALTALVSAVGELQKLLNKPAPSPVIPTKGNLAWGDVVWQS